ncbi:hypothetical protein ABKN59_004157 [Abortiporus biennis]
MGVEKAFLVLDTALVALCVYDALRRKETEKKRSRMCEGSHGEKVDVETRKPLASRRNLRRSTTSSISLIGLTSSLPSSDVAQAGFFVYDTLRVQNDVKRRPRRRDRGRVEVKTPRPAENTHQRFEVPETSRPLQTHNVELNSSSTHMEGQPPVETCATISSSNLPEEVVSHVPASFVEQHATGQDTSILEELTDQPHVEVSLQNKEGFILEVHDVETPDDKCEAPAEIPSRADISNSPLPPSSEEEKPDVAVQLELLPETNVPTLSQTCSPSPTPLPDFEEERTLVELEEPKALDQNAKETPIVAKPLQPEVSPVDIEEESFAQPTDEIKEFLNMVALVHSASMPVLEVLGASEAKISASSSAPSILKSYLDIPYNGDGGENQIPSDNCHVCSANMSQQSATTSETTADLDIKKTPAPRHKRAKRGGKNRRSPDRSSAAGSNEKVPGRSSASSSRAQPSPPANAPNSKASSRQVSSYTKPVSGGVKLGVLGDKSNTREKKTSGSRPPRKPCNV